MNRFALLTFWRSLTRHRLYAALNIGGLALGIAVFLVLLVYVRFETGYDRFLPNWRHLYLIELANVPVDAKGYAQGAPTALWSAVRRDMPGAIGARMLERSATVEHSGVGTAETFALVDPDLAGVFGIVPIRGSLADLRDPTRLVLTQRTARKYFGNADPIGRGLTIKVQGVARDYSVAAVISDWPANSDIDFDLLAPLVVSDDPRSTDWGEEHSWQWWNARTYVSLPTANGAARFMAGLKAVVARHSTHDTPDSADVRIQHRLQPIADLHFEAPGRALAVTTLGVVGLLTLLVAAVNYVNLATARAGLRAREVAMRKVLGADRRTLFVHYLFEAIATAAIAAVVGAAMAELAMPVMDAAIGLDLKLRYFGNEGVALPLVSVTLAIGLIAGLYPALVLSRFPAAAVLASARSPGGGRGGARVRSALVAFQFGIAVAFVIATMVMGAQVAHVRAADVGFRREQLMLIPSLARSDLDVSRREAVLHRLDGLPQVSAVTVADTVPGPGAFHANTFLARRDQPGSDKTFSLANVAPHYFETLGAHLIAGRWFDGAHPGDVDANYRPDFAPPAVARPINIVINRVGARVLGFADPSAAIGKDVAAAGDPPTMIVGVIDDMRFGGARDPVPPTAYHYVATAPGNGIAIVRYRGDTAAMAGAVGSVWLASAPSVPLKVLTAAANQDVYNKADDHSARLLGVGAMLAVAIGCIGLWGLASFNTARRIKEIGIRKTLGASSTDIVRLLLGQFLRPVLLANVVAWPLAYVAMRVWLAGFDDRISLSPLFFAAATLLALVVALVTVLAQSLRASRATPAWALRRE